MTSDTNSYKQIVVGTQLMSRKEGFAGEHRTKKCLLYLEASITNHKGLIWYSEPLSQNVRKGPLPTHSMLSLDTISQ